jgi:phage gp46-like protein
MGLDLAMDYNTGDLKIAPNKDLERRIGEATVEQRIRVRLRIYQGEWALDPTDGQLGSRLHDVTRLPAWRATQEAGLVIREALEPMDDIRVQDVQVSVDDKNVRILDVVILYAHVEPNGQLGGTVQLTTSITVGD